MAKQNVKVELFYNSTWNDHTDDTRMASEITITRGVTNPGDEATPSICTLTFGNRTGKMNPRNATGALYGLIGQNTQIRVTVGTSQRFQGEIRAWKPAKTPDWKGANSTMGDAWVDITATGVLGRLSRGLDTVKGALERTVEFNDPVAYWKLDDGSDATEAASALDDGNTLTVYGTAPTWASDNSGFAGSLPCAKVVDQVTAVTTDVLRGRITGLSGTGVTMSLWFKATTDDTNLAHIVSKELVHFTPPPTGLANPDPYVRIGISTRSGSDAYMIFDGSGYASMGAVGSFDGNWHNIVVQMFQNGAGHIQCDIWFDGAMGTGTDAHSPAYTLNAFTDLVVIPVEDMVFGPNSIWLGHVAIFDGVSVDPTDIWSAGRGNVDEPADFRFSRICDELGVTDAIDGTSGQTQPMGPQYPDTLLNTISQIEQTDDAQIHDSRSALALRMTTGRSLLRQTAALTVDYASGQISPDPMLLPLVGDEHIRNDVTAKKPNNSTGRYVKTSGALSTTAVGTYNTQITVDPSGSINFTGTSVTDVEALRNLASWRVAKGTYEGPWYQQVTVDLDAAPSLVSTVDPVDIGDMIKITGLPVDEVATGSVRHLVIGYTEHIGSHRRTITYNLQPADPYDAGILGATNQAGYLDCRGSTVNGSLTSTATTLPLNITDGCTWTHASGDYDILVGGERMTVTAVGSVSGSFPSRTQSLTVTRSVNGVIKAHASGEEVHVADPFILAL